MVQESSEMVDPFNPIIKGEPFAAVDMAGNGGNERD